MPYDVFVEEQKDTLPGPNVAEVYFACLKEQIVECNWCIC